MLTSGRRRGSDDEQELDDLFGADLSGSSDEDGSEGAMDDDEAKEAIANGMDPVRSPHPLKTNQFHVDLCSRFMRLICMRRI